VQIIKYKNISKIETRRKTWLILLYIKTIKNVREKKNRKKEFEWIKKNVYI